MTAVKFKVKKGDRVTIVTGKDKGKTGDIISVMKSESKVLVKGLNMVKKHVKPSADQTGGIIEKELPIHISNVALIDPQDNKPTKVGIKIDSNGNKYRYAKKSGLAI